MIGNYAVKNMIAVHLELKQAQNLFGTIGATKEQLICSYEKAL